MIKLLIGTLCLACAASASTKDVVKEDAKWVYRCTAQAKEGDATGATTIYLNARGKGQFHSTDLSWSVATSGPTLQISSTWYHGISADSFPEVRFTLFAHELPRAIGRGPLRFEMRTDAAKPASDQRLIGFAKRSSGQFSFEISAAAVSDLVKLRSPVWLVAVDKEGREAFHASLPISQWPQMLKLAKQSSADAIAMTKSFERMCENQSGVIVIT